MRRADLAIRWLVVLTWALHVTAFVVFDWKEASPLLWGVNVVGFIGLLAALAWLRVGSPWRRPCIYASSVAVALYIARWYINISTTYRTEPDGGILAAIGRVAHVVSVRFTWQEERLGAAWALLHLYWDVLMLPVQLLVIAILIWMRLPHQLATRRQQ
jgi:hypothetical protein